MDQNCDSDLPVWTCTLGNVAGVISTVLWFAVLLPQVLRNQLRGSVAGLNPLWAIANFTASICNAFFMFRIDVPAQTRVMAVYMPVIEFCMLLQFWAWWWPSPITRHDDDVGDDGENKVNEEDNKTSPAITSSFFTFSRFRVTLVCSLLFTAIIGVQIFFPESSGSLAWVAIVLWSVETFPQLYTDISSPGAAVSGQATVSILITVCGKTTDALSAYLLVMPEQTRVLAYFSGTSAWLNAFYVLVLYIQQRQQQQQQHEDASSKLSSSSSTSPRKHSPQISETNRLIITHEEDAASQKMKNKNTLVQQRCVSCLHVTSDSIEDKIRALFTSSAAARVVLGAFLVVEMTAVLIAAVIRIWKLYVVVLPLVTIVILVCFHAFLARWHTSTAGSLA